MNKTKIEYLDYTWNPIAMRCDPVSAGCANCWHRRMANRLAKNPVVNEAARNAYDGGKPILIKSRLDDPMNVIKASRIGVQFMGDLFHKSIDFHKGTDRVLAEMEDCPRHTFLILTKRPERLLEYHNYLEFEHTDGSGKIDTSSWEWPKNIYLGVSVEDQAAADERIPILLQIPAAVRFVSVEPCLENIQLTQHWVDYLEGWTTEHQCCGYGLKRDGSCCGNPEPAQAQTPHIDWVIAGPETGPGARPCPGGAIENLYEQCKAVGIPFFDKRKDFIAREFPK